MLDPAVKVIRGGYDTIWISEIEFKSICSSAWDRDQLLDAIDSQQKKIRFLS